MGDGIQINRVAERSSSHTQTRSRRRERRPSADAQALRERLIAAFVETVSAGGGALAGASDPRLI